MPTGRLAALAALGVLAAAAAGGALGWAVVAALDAALVAMAAFDYGRAPRPSAVRVARELPAVVPLGEEATLRWSLRWDNPRAGRVALADDLPASLGADRRRVVAWLPAGGRAEAHTQLRPTRRGDVTLAGCTLRTFGPWGLVARQARRPVADRLRVVPSFRSRQATELRLHRARILEQGTRAARLRGSGTEIDRLREFVVDDEYRRIDWAATARAGKLIVRDYRTERNQPVMVLLDTGRAMAGRISEAGEAGGEAALPRLDHAMDAVLALATVASRLGDRTGMVAYADRVRAVAPPTSPAAQLRTITDAMYALGPQLVESDPAGAFRHTVSRFRRRGLLVVMTELLAGALEESLLPALPLVARRHVVVVVAVRDPLLDELVAAAPRDATDAHRRAAAADALTTRRELVGRLQAAGARVVDEPPGPLATRVVDAYLDLKVEARL